MSKPDTKNLKYVLCFNCCTIFSAKNNPDKKCPDCGYCPNPHQYKKIMTYAISSVYYGHDYRQRYEKQIIEKGKIIEKYALPDPLPILIFLAVQVLRYIISGISYDIFKKAFHVILRKAFKLKGDIGQNKINIINNADIKIFIQQINDFHLDFKDIDPAVKREIKKEMFIWEQVEAEKKAMKNLIKKNKVTEEDIFNETMKELKKVKYLHKPSKKDFTGFWGKIDDKDS